MSEARLATLRQLLMACVVMLTRVMIHDMEEIWAACRV